MIFKKNTTILLFILVTFFYQCNAQDNTPEKISNNFFNVYKEQGSSKALDYIFSTNKFISEKDVKTMKEQLIQYANILGEYHGNEVFIKNTIGNSIEIHSYVLKYERQPIRFILTFYKPKDKWKLHNFKISDDFVEELESATIELSYKNDK